MIKGLKFWSFPTLTGRDYFIQWKMVTMIICFPIYCNSWTNKGIQKFELQWQKPMKLLIDRDWENEIPF